MSPRNITDEEQSALDDANLDLCMNPSVKAAARLLRAAYDAWDEGHLGECDYAREVAKVERWLSREAGL